MEIYPTCFLLKVEYVLVKFDHENKTAKLLLKSKPLLKELQKEEFENPGYIDIFWHYLLDYFSTRMMQFKTSLFAANSLILNCCITIYLKATIYCDT